MAIALCPGSYDPITVGHTDIIRRAAGLFETVYVVVANNPGKHYLFSVEHRTQFCTVACAPFPNVRIVAFDGMITDLAEQLHADVLVKGLLNSEDFDYEYPMQYFNLALNTRPETVFLASAPQFLPISSSAVRELLFWKREIRPYVPDSVADMIQTLYTDERK